MALVVREARVHTTGMHRFTPGGMAAVSTRSSDKCWRRRGTVSPSLLRHRRRQSSVAAAEDRRSLAEPRVSGSVPAHSPTVLVLQAARPCKAPAVGFVRPHPGRALSGGRARRLDSVAGVLSDQEERWLVLSV